MKRASELADGQFGAIARRQLLELGLSSSRVESWMLRGLLHPKYPGVYAFGRAELAERGQLAAGLLFTGPGSALGGLSALWWQELLARRPEQVHIDAPGKKTSRQDLRIRHPGRIIRHLHAELPVVELPRALLVSAADLSHDALRLVLARAEFKRILHLPSLQSALGEGRSGTQRIRAAMDAHLPQLARCANGLERDFVLLCERHAIELPEPNPRIGRYRPDMLWPEQRLIAELDGGDAHHTPAQLQADAARQAHLEALGYTVIRFTWGEVTHEPERVAATVREALSGPAPRRPPSRPPSAAPRRPSR